MVVELYLASLIKFQARDSFRTPYFIRLMASLILSFMIELWMSCSACMMSEVIFRSTHLLE